jgi:hypothetical protein
MLGGLCHDPDRSDLDLYAAIASELGARHVLGLGAAGPARSRFSLPTAAWQ